MQSYPAVQKVLGSLKVVQCDTRFPQDAKAVSAYKAKAGTIADALIQPVREHVVNISEKASASTCGTAMV